MLVGISGCGIVIGCVVMVISWIGMVVFCVVV